MCVANSARSQMAEGLARALSGGAIEIHSAGSEPKSVHPMAKGVMEEWGIDVGAHHSKGVEEVPLERVSHLITLCAEEHCPYVPGTFVHMAWPHPDPAPPSSGQGDVDPSKMLESFREVRGQILEKLKNFYVEAGIEIRGDL